MPRIFTECLPNLCLTLRPHDEQNFLRSLQRPAQRHHATLRKIVHKTRMLNPFLLSL